MLEKWKNKLTALPKKAKVMLTTAMMMCFGSAVAFAEGEADMTMSTTQLQSIMTAITTQINVSTIVSYLVAIIAVAIVFVLMWWGVRKAISAVMGAIRGGTLGV